MSDILRGQTQIQIYTQKGRVGYRMSVLLYSIMGLGAFCLLTKFVVSCMYARLIKEAGQMGKSEHRLMKMLLNKFETCYQLKMGVENVEIFVDKYVNAFRIMGIHLNTWEVIGDVIFGVTLLISLLTNLYITIMQYNRETMTKFLLVGIVVCGVVILEDMILNLRFKKKRLMVELQDYLENIYKPRLENQVFHSEEMEKYHREYFDAQEPNEPEPAFKIQFTKEEEAVIEEVLKEYMV